MTQVGPALDKASSAVWSAADLSVKEVRSSQDNNKIHDGYEVRGEAHLLQQRQNLIVILNTALSRKERLDLEEISVGWG